jgi:RNA polymerase sigma-70 factor, ECF subfamily
MPANFVGVAAPQGRIRVNRKPAAGVFLPEAEMDALAASLPVSAVSLDASLEHEFERLLGDCPTLAYRVALSVLRNTAEAEDVAQEAVIRAYRNFHRLRERESFRPWIVRVAWRLALDRIRAAGRRERREQAALAAKSAAPAVEDVAASNEFERHVASALDELPEKLRLVMVLAAIEGYNTREVANLIGVPEGTVKSRLHLARKQMAEKLQCHVKNIRGE